MSKARILIVEDHEVAAQAIVRQLTRLDYEPVGQTAYGEQAVDLAGQLHPDLVLMDIQLAGAMDGISAAREIRDQFAIPVVFATAMTEGPTFDRAKLTEPFGYIMKPVGDRELRTVIETALYKHQAEMRLRNSQMELAAILRTAMDGFCLLDAEGRFLEVNDAYCRMMGYSREELMRMAIRDVEADETPAEVTATIRHIRSLGSSRFERRNRRKDGRIVDVEASVNSLPGGDGRMVCFVRDISERKRDQESLRASEEKFRTLFNNAEVGMFRSRLDGSEVLDVNNKYLSMLGRSPEDILGKPSEILWADVNQREEMVKTLKAKGCVSGLECRLIKNGGEFLDCITSLRLYADQGILEGSILDITDRKRAESERATENELLRLINEIQDYRQLMRSVTSLLQKYTGCEAVGLRLREGDDFPYFETRGFPAEFVEAENRLCVRDWQGELQRDTQGNPFLECMCGNVICGRFNPALPFFTAGGSFWSNSTTHLLASTSQSDRQARTRNRCNGEGYESVALVPLRTAGKTFGLMQFNDHRKGRFTAEGIRFLEQLAGNLAAGLAEREMAESLRASEEKYRAVFEQAPNTIVLVDAETGGILEFNETAYKTLGYTREEFAALKIADIEAVKSSEEIAAHMQRIRSTGGDAFETRFRVRDGRLIDMMLNIHMVSLRGQRRFLVVATDVSARKQTEQALRQSEKLQAEAEKLAATGRMAAQVAHEINNPLAGIKNSFRLIKDAVPQDHPDRDMVGRIEREINRIAQIVRQMYQIYSPRTDQLTDVPVAQAIHDVATMLEPLCRQNEMAIEVKSISAELTVRAYPGSLQQIVYNLTVNAIQASPPRCVVHVIVDPADNDQVRISICDHGSGIPAEVRSRMFEPFISADTGSSTNHGLGLGLAIVKNIVESLRGSIVVESDAVQGTCFRVYLPSK